MFKVHGIHNNLKVLDMKMNHLPRTGETIRLDSDLFYKVTEVVWCLDEPQINSNGTTERINLRLESIE